MAVPTQRFNNSVKKFQIRDLDIIGNSANGHFIFLSNKGLDFVNKIFNNQGLVETDIGENKPLFEKLHKFGYFSEIKTTHLFTSVYFHITNFCNLNCLGCYSNSEKRNTKKDLSFTDIKYILDELKKHKVRNIVISGGEPLLRKDLIQICQYCRQFAKVEVISNGTMEIDDYLQIIPHIDNLHISIDGYDESTSFIRNKGIMPKILENISGLKGKVNLNMIATVHAKNVSYISNYKGLSHRLGVPISFSLLTVDAQSEDFKGYVLTDESFERLLDSAGHSLNTSEEQQYNGYSLALKCKARCGVCSVLLSIDADGTVYPCHMLHDERYNLGNMLESNLEDILERNIQTFLYKYDVDALEDCADCTYKYFCGGGCRAMALLTNGNIKKGKHGLCILAKESIDKGIEAILDRI